MSIKSAWVVLAGLGLAVAPTVAHAQWERADTAWCDEEWGRSESDRVCFTLTGDFPNQSRLTVDAGLNGGVSVEGWSGERVEVRARVWANAGDETRAREIANQVRPRMEDGRLSADGPRTERREHWGVSWAVMVPYATDLDLETHNGGIAVTDVTGRIRFEALNGGVDLTGVGGDVAGRTTNGGLHIELDGNNWDGERLDVETTNGGVTLRIPADYSARLETGTVNGGIDIDFPVTVQGRLGRSLVTTLGEGGPLVRAVTTNGGVTITRASAIR
jgi:hypothetical protein